MAMLEALREANSNVNDVQGYKDVILILQQQETPFLKNGSDGLNLTRRFL